ncbi:MAG: hypothetical protein IJI14_05050 [Anaerolineaceae bacterium]|nr:hypothetical protein [Anaerolineaceae bacterium]
MSEITEDNLRYLKTPDLFNEEEINAYSKTGFGKEYLKAELFVENASRFMLRDDYRLMDVERYMGGIVFVILFSLTLGILGLTKNTFFSSLVWIVMFVFCLAPLLIGAFFPMIARAFGMVYSNCMLFLHKRSVKR